MLKETTYIYVLLMVVIESAGECTDKKIATCPTGVKAFECMHGCDCRANVLTCSEGYPLCVGTLFINKQTAPFATTINNQSLVNICEENVHNIVIRDLYMLTTIEAGFFHPLAGVVQEIYIRNNTRLTELKDRLFQDDFRHLKVLAVEKQSTLTDISFLRSPGLRNVTELLLAFNNISEITCGAFQYFRKLEKLDLQGNQIVYLDECQLNPLPYYSSHMQINLRSNPLHCNCSLLPILNGEVSKFEVIMPNDTMCTLNTYNEVGLPEPRCWPILVAMETLHHPFNRSLYDDCTQLTAAVVRNQSRCSCEHEIPALCKPDCVFLAKREKCDGTSEHINDDHWLLNVEGCFCKFGADYWEHVFGGNVKNNYCAARGQLAQFLVNVEWKIWLSVTAFVLVVCLLPLAFNLYKYCNEQGEEEEDDLSIDEEFLDYLLNPDESSWKTRRDAVTPIYAPVLSLVERLQKRISVKKEPKKSTPVEDVNIRFSDNVKTDTEKVNPNQPSSIGLPPRSSVETTVKAKKTSKSGEKMRKKGSKKSNKTSSDTNNNQTQLGEYKTTDEKNPTKNSEIVDEKIIITPTDNKPSSTSRVSEGVTLQPIQSTNKVPSGLSVGDEGQRSLSVSTLKAAPRKMEDDANSLYPMYSALDRLKVDNTSRRSSSSTANELSTLPSIRIGEEVSPSEVVFKNHNTSPSMLPMYSALDTKTSKVTIRDDLSINTLASRQKGDNESLSPLHSAIDKLPLDNTSQSTPVSTLEKSSELGNEKFVEADQPLASDSFESINEDDIAKTVNKHGH